MENERNFKPTFKGLMKWRKVCVNMNKIMLIKLGIIRHDVIVRMRNGLKLNLVYEGKHDTTTMLKDLYINNSYSFDEMDFDDCKIIVDIGANQGFVSTLLALKCKEAKIYAYEPIKRSYDSLVKNSLLNDFNHRIIPFNLAVSKKKGKIKLYLDKSGNAASSILKSRAKSENTLYVDSITLEDIFTFNNLDHIDLLKVDCEGAEYEIFYNTTKECLSKIKKIILEAHLNDEYKQCELVSFLKQNNFTVHEKRNEITAINKQPPFHLC